MNNQDTNKIQELRSIVGRIAELNKIIKECEKEIGELKKDTLDLVNWGGVDPEEDTHYIEVNNKLYALDFNKYGKLINISEENGLFLPEAASKFN